MKDIPRGDAESPKARTKQFRLPHPGAGLQVLAAHEAGHVVVGLSYGGVLDKVMLMADGATVRWLREGSKYPSNEFGIEVAGGAAGEILAFGAFSPMDCRTDRHSWLMNKDEMSRLNRKFDPVGDFLSDVDKAYEILRECAGRHQGIMSYLLTCWSNGEPVAIGEEIGDLPNIPHLGTSPGLYEDH